jgi:UDP-GlcNAc:undecaprenyl-phosphate GlcNAc-1-phosphate transferase
MALETLQHMSTIGLAGVTSLGFTFALTPLVRLIAVRFGWIAKPVEDRWGRRIVARLGGAAMFLGFMGGALLWVPLEPTVRGLLVGVTLVFALGLLDDLRRMPPYTKLVAQLLIGCAVVISGIRITLGPWAWLSIPLSVLWFVLVMNAFNLLDNMDGLAAGVGAIAAGFCALHAALASQWTVATAAAVVSGVCLGFLHYNLPPAKIFMGDSGSHLLGLSLAALALMGSWHHSTQLLSVLAVPTLVLAVPIFDTCFVTVQRLTHRRHPFAGGTDHVSHRLAILGLSARQTVIALYGISACLGLVSVVSASLKPLPTLAIWLAVLTGLILFGRYLAQVNVYRLEPQPNEFRLSEQGKSTTFIDTMLLHKRRLVEILVDFCLLSSTYVFAHLLRFEGLLSGDLQQLIVQSLPIILVIKLACFAGCGLYQGVWRYLGLSDILTVFKAVTFGSILSSVALLYLWRFEGYSRAVLIIDWMLTFFAVGGSRVLERVLNQWIGAVGEQGVPVLIIGAGDTGERVLRYFTYEGRSTRRIVGFLDDDARKHGNRIHGSLVLGGRERLPETLQGYRIREVLIAISDPPGELLQYVQQHCERLGVTWKVVTAGVTDAL